MKIVADTNILFSILLKPAGKTYALFNALAAQHTICIAERTLTELLKHHERILKISRLPEEELLSVKEALINRTQIIYGSELPSQAISMGYNLVFDIDVDDTAFVATTIYLNAILWSGDKPLNDGLRAKGFTNIYDSLAIQTLLL